MNTIQTNQTNSQTFTIYRDGQIDRSFEIKKATQRILGGLGHISYKVVEETFDMLDQWVAAGNK